MLVNDSYNRKEAVMTQYNVTLNGEMVRELFLTGCEGVIKDLVEQVLNQLLEARAEDKCNAKPYEQTEERMDYRNGVRERGFVTRLGKIELEVPRLRGQSVVDGLFEKYKRSEQAIIAGVAEMVVKGVSTRKVNDVAEALFGEGISKSQASRMCAVLDPVVAEFRERPLEAWYPFGVVDAIYLKIRCGDRVISKALYIFIGVNADGLREVLGFMVSQKETKAAYVEFFRSLKARGLERFDLVTSDDHDGLREAIKQEFLGTSWQRCQTHFTKNILDKTPKKMWAEVKTLLRDIYTAPDIEAARIRKDAAVALLTGPTPKAALLLDESFDDITAVFSLPLKYRQKMRTSNGIERLNEEIRRRERVIRIFPSDDSVMRIIGTLLLDQTEAWLSGRLYLDMREYLEFVAERDRQVSACPQESEALEETPPVGETAEKHGGERAA
jgi:transposase-like protein